MAEPTAPWSADPYYESTDKLPYVQAAYAKVPNRDPNFKFYLFERIGTDGIKCTGCVMRPLTKGPRKGQPMTTKEGKKEVVVVAAEIEKFTPNQGNV